MAKAIINRINIKNILHKSLTIIQPCFTASTSIILLNWATLTRIDISKVNKSPNTILKAQAIQLSRVATANPTPSVIALPATATGLAVDWAKEKLPIKKEKIQKITKQKIAVLFFLIFIKKFFILKKLK